MYRLTGHSLSHTLSHNLLPSVRITLNGSNLECPASPGSQALTQPEGRSLALLLQLQLGLRTTHIHRSHLTRSNLKSVMWHVHAWQPLLPPCATGEHSDMAIY